MVNTVKESEKLWYKESEHRKKRSKRIQRRKRVVVLAVRRHRMGTPHRILPSIHPVEIPRRTWAML
jgi:hypothetical protein